MKKIKVAITGNIGSGKSTLSGLLVKKGYAVIIADDISIQLLKTDEFVKRKVISLFGNEVYTSGKLNNKFVAGKVFSNPELLDKLNSILHPRVLHEIDKIIEKDFQNEKVIFIESALVYETKIEDNFDYIVLITSDFSLRMKRTLANGKFNEVDFKNREKNQIPQEEKVKKADFVFTNNGSEEELFQKAELLLLTLGIQKK
ncbi:MAG: dephospho-CoA kinase [Ignavibacteria bacterium]|jgi:dephospho-CoA kinase